MPTLFARPVPFFLPFAALVLAAGGRGQCTTQWLPGPPLPGVDLAALAVVEWDPDGAGPRGPVVVIGGGFTTAGNVPANNIVAFDPATGQWSMFGTGMNQSVRALAVLPSGDLVAGGSFTTAGGVAANFIARWDGVAWSPLGTGTTGDVRALAVLPSGELAVGGFFTTAGGVAAHKIALWDGLAWTNLGAGPGPAIGNAVFALTVLQNGELVAGGNFNPSGGPPANPVARWTGTSWVPLGTGLTGQLWALTTLANGDVVAGGGAFSTGTGVARWNGTSWTALGNAPSGVQGICRLANGDVVAVGSNSPARWNGSTWSPIGTMGAYGYGTCVAQLGSGNVIAGGSFAEVDGVSVANVATWNGTTWSYLGATNVVPAATTAAIERANGDLVVAGAFESGGLYLGCVLTWNGSVWTQLGGNFNSAVYDVVQAPNGDLFACGWFLSVGGVPSPRVARWNGTTWSPVGLGVGLGVNTLLAMPNGDIVAGGIFSSAGGAPANGIARWNGTAWAPVGAGLSSEVNALALAANGDILAGGAIYPSRVMRWDGVAWSPVGALTGTVFALATMPNGDIVAGGSSLHTGGSPLNCIARWNGTTWSPLGAGMAGGPGVSLAEVNGLTVLPAGDLVACGRFVSAGSVFAHGVARWNGSAWSALATSGTDFPTSVASMANGDLVVTGVSRMEDTVSVGFARLTTTCPATAVASSAPCAGNTLAATGLPWLGATFRAQATGLPLNALAVDVFGVSSASVPLPLLMPQGVAGCSLAVNPDSLGLLVPSGGTVATQLAIPNTASLVGVVVHEQVLAVGLGAGGAITTFTGTNRLTVTVGVF